MPTASKRASSGGKGGGATSSNETAVSTNDDPNPTRVDGASRRADTGRQGRASPTGADPAPKDKASGRDHPSESEHDHEHQKLHGESAKRIGGKPGS